MKKIIAIISILFFSACEKTFVSPDASVRYEIQGTGNCTVYIDYSLTTGYGSSSYGDQLPFSYTATYKNGDSYNFSAMRNDAGTSKIYFYMYVNDVLAQKDSVIHGGVNFTGTFQ